MKTSFWIFLIILVGLASFLVVADLNRFNTQQPVFSLAVEDEMAEGFKRANGPRDWNFPSDYGPHPDYQTEWWYYTGNLESQNSDRFGYQLIFFRRSLLPAEKRIERASTWATDQIFMAHFAISDIGSGKHYVFERFARGAAGLAGAQADPYHVWLENWQVQQIGNNQYHLKAEQGEASLDLILDDIKGPILHGDNGYSQKGLDPSNASYYYSQTRLATSGSIQIAESIFRVNGLSWKDHEFSTGALSAGQVGWDWFSIQLDNGSELMIFQIRREDGSIDPISSGTWISPQGETFHLKRDHFEIQVQDSWRSPKSGADYPSEWAITIIPWDAKLNITPLLADQEMDLSYNYWEGAVDVIGTIQGVAISGSGYIEMTGYAASIEGEF